MRDPLQCTVEDASLNQLRDGIALSTAAKVDFFEEMLSFALHFGARDRRARDSGKARTPESIARNAAPYQIIDRRKERGKGLARSGGRCNQRMATGADRGPGRELRRGRRGKRVAEPIRDGRMEVLKWHAGILPA